MTETHNAKRGHLKRAVATTAPKLAAALGGPLAGAAVAQISRAIFGRENVDDDEISEFVEGASPEQLLALQKAEQEFSIALEKIDLDRSRLDVEDRANARLRQTAMDDWTPSALGALIILGFFIVLGFMIARKFPPGAETEFSIMLGALATMTAAVVNYFFGSSAGSKEKTRLMANTPMPVRKKKAG